MTRSRTKRVVLAAAGVAVVMFAIQGGEFGTSDLLRLELRERRLRAAIDSLQRDVDSLTRLKRAIETDPALQERIAREEFGMVRGDNEILYRFAEPPKGDRPRAGGRRSP